MDLLKGNIVKKLANKTKPLLGSQESEIRNSIRNLPYFSRGVGRVLKKEKLDTWICHSADKQINESMQGDPCPPHPFFFFF